MLEREHHPGMENPCTFSGVYYPPDPNFVRNKHRSLRYQYFHNYYHNILQYTQPILANQRQDCVLLVHYPK